MRMRTQASLVVGLALTAAGTALAASSGWTHTIYGVTCGSWAKPQAVMCGPRGAARSYAATVSKNWLTVFQLPSGKTIFLKAQPPGYRVPATHLAGWKAYGVVCQPHASGSQRVVMCMREDARGYAFGVSTEAMIVVDVDRQKVLFSKHQP